MKHKLRTQKRIPGQVRQKVGTAVNKEIERRLKQEMAHFNVSRSFVIANALAFTFNIEMEDNYRKRA